MSNIKNTEITQIKKILLRDHGMSMGKKEIRAICSSYITFLKERLLGGYEVRIPILGKFSFKLYPARIFKTYTESSELGVSKAKLRLDFKVASNFKDEINLE